MRGYQSGTFTLSTQGTFQKSWSIPIGQTLRLSYRTGELLRGGASYVGDICYDSSGYPGAMSDTISSEKYIYLTVRN